MTSREAERSGQRLEALREMFNLTQTGLADRVGVNQSFLSRIEKGERPLPAELVAKLTMAYKVPATFFEVPPTDREGLIQTFWKTSKATAADERRIKRLHREAARIFESISEDSGYRATDFVDPVDHGGNVEQVAAVTRKRIGVTAGAPIMNTARTLERLGVGVVTNLDGLDPDSTDHKGISMPHSRTGRPLVGLISEMNGADRRFALMHELGHLIFDQGLSVPIRTRRDPAELRAHQFARAMLLPAEAVSDQISESLNLQGYLGIKAEFGAPVGAIIKRGRDLGLISADRERSLFIQWSSQGWRKNEPVEVATEKPLLLSQALTEVYGSDRSHAARELGLPASLLGQWAQDSDWNVGPREDARVIDLASRRRGNS